MTARILVVDDIPANVKLLEARLTAEYFEVVTAGNGIDALEICETDKIDVVLLDIMMPGMDGFEVCRRLKSSKDTAHIPVIIVTALDQASDRIRGLECGADDFLTKPVNDMQLVARVRSLVRLKMLTDELRLRAVTTRGIGLEDLMRGTSAQSGDSQPRVLLIDERPSSFERICKMLKGIAAVDVVTEPQAGFLQAAENPYECVVISTGFSDYDPLRISSHLRSLDRTRYLPIILIADQGEDERIMRGLDIGINDYLIRPVDQQELAARLNTQIKRKLYNDALRENVTNTIEMAVTDGLTGLHNRRYLDNHLRKLFERAKSRKTPLSIIMTDLDHFKSINDTHGHDGGDEVLRQFADRLRKKIRGIDLICRFGGEEFVIIMPDTDAAIAAKVAERMRLENETAPFLINNGQTSLKVTASAGVAGLDFGNDSVESLMKRADLALYEAKTGGRNRVVTKVGDSEPEARTA